MRISKGVGTRGSRRDLLGLAVRLTDLPNGPVDLLFSTVGRLPVTRAFFSVVTGWCTRPYSTVLPYRADGDLVRLGLSPRTPTAPGAPTRRQRVPRCDAARCSSRWSMKPRGGGWTPIGRLVLDLPLPDAAEDDDSGAIEPVAYDPMVNAHPRLRPVRPLAGLRTAAYVGSRRGRGAEEPAGVLSGKPLSRRVRS